MINSGLKLIDRRAPVLMASIGVVVCQSSLPFAYADQAIVTTSSEIVRSPLLVTTNAIVLKLTTNMARIDWSVELSVLTRPDKGEIVELHHLERTYIRRSADPLGSANVPADMLGATWEASKWRDKSAEMLIWTNGSQTGALYVAKPGDVAVGLSVPPTVAYGPTAGSLVGSALSPDRVVVRTVMTNSVMVPAASFSVPGASGITNLSFSVTTELVSVVLTNLPDSEFAIPEGYAEVAAHVPKPAAPPKGLFGTDPVGLDGHAARMEQLRKGTPIFIPLQSLPIPPRVQPTRP